MTPLDQLRLRLPAHELDRMQAAKPVAEPDRDAMLKDIAAEFGQHEVVGPGLLHRTISDAMMSLTSAVPDDVRVVGHGGQGRQATNSAASFTDARRP